MFLDCPSVRFVHLSVQSGQWASGQNGQNGQMDKWANGQMARWPNGQSGQNGQVGRWTASPERVSYWVTLGTKNREPIPIPCFPF